MRTTSRSMSVRQHVHRDSLRKKAIRNAACFKRLEILKEQVRSLMRELRSIEQEKETLADDLVSAHITIDSLELLGKKEEALKHDIRILIRRRNELLTFFD